MGLKQEIITRSEGITANSIMTECERHGIVHGCTVNCPALIDGNCELKDSDNKDLYEEMLLENK